MPSKNRELCDSNYVPSMCNVQGNKIASTFT